LDLGCGYGRFTNILARQGYRIEGIDISPNLVAKARKIAKSEGINTKFKIGDIRKLPYKNDSFDVLICMWSVFAELPKEKDQIKSLKEMLRVLKDGGLAFLDLPEPQKIKTKTIIHFIGNIKGMSMFNHTKTTLKNLMTKIKQKNIESLLIILVVEIDYWLFYGNNPIFINL